MHINSGIPNKAFQLAAVAVGGTSWDGVGTVWYSALTSGLAPDTDFAGFAAATVAAAGGVSPEVEAAVTQAWADVGVTPAATAAPPTSAPAPAGRVAVARSGGFAGIRRSGELVLGDDPRTPEVESLISRIDLAAVASSTPQPDRFVYTFHVQGQELVVGEPDLTPDLQQLARIVLP